MKKVLKVFLIIAAIVVLLIAAICGFLYYVVYYASMVPKNYTEETETGGSLEADYLSFGQYEVGHIEEKAAEPANQYVIYYPKELENSEKDYPVVVVVNGTGVFANKEKPLFEHLASWGFIVAGNHDGSAWSGESADMTLDYLLRLNETEDSIFYHKVDTGNIGITGHSQGGVGVFNEIQKNKRSGLYRCAVSLSPTEEAMANLLGMPYDSSKTHIPVMILAGTENNVISLEAMEDMYRKIDAPKVIARKTGQGHGEMLYTADGYVTAWFMYYLQGDETAGQAFFGDMPELLYNPLYQDQEISSK